MNGPFPDSFISKMEKKDRPRGWMPYDEAKKKFIAGEERKLQSLVANYLNLHAIYFEQDRMDKRTSGKKGRPDFRCCYRGRFLAIECKAESGRLSSEQAVELARIRKSGGYTCVAMLLEDVQGALREIDYEIKVTDDAVWVGSVRHGMETRK
jgi:hypothetical protein